MNANVMAGHEHALENGHWNMNPYLGFDKRGRAYYTDRAAGRDWGRGWVIGRAKQMGYAPALPSEVTPRKVGPTIH